MSYATQSRKAKSQAAELALRARLEELGGDLLSPDRLDLGSKRGYITDYHALRASVAFAEFRAALESQGVTLIDERWRGAIVRHSCRCPAGHLASISPHKLGQGHRPCTECPTPTELAAEQKFRAAVARLGGTVTGQYVDTRTRVEVICAEGHRNAPFPTGVIQGSGFCRECVGKSPAAAERKFRELVALHGGKVVGPWLRSGEGVHCICPVGHDCYPRLGSLTRGQGLCHRCSGTSPEEAEHNFRQRLAEGNAVLLDAYAGSLARHRIICPWNHVTTVTPTVVRQSGVYCDKCPEPRSLASERAFIIALAAHGATYVGPWTGCDKPVAIICAEGHRVTAYPTNLACGKGPCRICAGKSWDVFYVVTSAETVKFGITSGDPRPRLANHASRGLANVALLATALPGAVAPDTEKAVKVALADAGEEPLQGKELFNISCLALILDVATSWTTPVAT